MGVKINFNFFVRAHISPLPSKILYAPLPVSVDIIWGILMTKTDQLGGRNLDQICAYFILGGPTPTYTRLLYHMVYREPLRT